jgi:TMEM175 potassium channel family protein
MYSRGNPFAAEHSLVQVTHQLRYLIPMIQFGPVKRSRPTPFGPALVDSCAMTAPYNRIAGQSVERLAALSDGIFAVAMTLLVLDLRVPATEAVRNERDLWHGLVVLAPRLLMYMMSFLTLGIFWVGQQTQLNHLARSDRSLSWIHIVFLFAVSITPFSTTLLAEFIRYRLALLAYWLNILALGVTLYFSWVCATEKNLVKDDIPAEVPTAIKRRIVIAQSLYAFGALLCFINTYWSIAFIVLVQLNYAVAPRFLRRSAS